MTLNYDAIKVTRPIVLVGLMGSGKSTVGFRLAKSLRLPFFDTDNLIEEIVGCPVKEIYKYAGEDFFKEKEREVLNKILSDKPSVISTGGGTFVEQDNRDLILKKAISVWLKADYDVILERVSRRNTRPLLDGNDREEVLHQLIDHRYPIYEMADIRIDSDQGPHMFIVDAIIDQIKQKFPETK